MMALNTTGNFTEVPEGHCCHGLWPAYAIGGLAPALTAQHLATVAALALCARAVHLKADRSHPVFAVVCQELLVLTTCEILGVILLLTSSFLERELVFLAYLLVCRTAAIFHPSTWLVVTYLR